MMVINFRDATPTGVATMVITFEDPMPKGDPKWCEEWAGLAAIDLGQVV